LSQSIKTAAVSVAAVTQAGLTARKLISKWASNVSKISKTHGI